ncbi:MAG: aminotransferase class V-fold PLP-dependent enzyme [Micromonosporaceae bacterium]
MNPASFRAAFPMLGRTVHLASCSLGARSVDLDAALARMLDAMSSSGAPWHDFEDEVTQARRRFATLIGADVDEIALVPNASVGAYQVASTLDYRDRPRIVTSDVEFPSIAHVWLAQRPRSAEVVYAEDIAAAIDDRTALVSIPAVTYLESARMPVARTVRAAHAAGAKVFVDAYQAVGVEPVDVRALDCDYLVAGTMKYLLGLPGVAFLYVRGGGAGDWPPQLTGWFGRTDPFAFDPRSLDYPDHARRFETGTPSVPAIYAANAGLGLISELDLAAVKAHIGGLLDQVAARLREQGETLRQPADAGAHLALLDEDPAELAAHLAGHHIAVSPRGAVVRLSFHYYSNLDDVHAVCEEIKQYRKATRSRPIARSTLGDRYA